ncbi:MAG: cupin domain-containing protein [Acidimicrobiales bacterium]
MSAIFQVNEEDLPWLVYEGSGDGPSAIRYKALTANAPDVPSVTYVEYGPGQTDSVHSHSTGEFFIVTDGALWLKDVETGPGGVVFIAANTDYSARAGDDGARFFRVVVH